MEVEITKDNFETLRNGDLPLVVDLWATWCGPCKAISPLVSKLAEEYDGKLVVGKCDVEQNEDITMEYAVRNIPTLLFFKDGKLVNKHVGAPNESKMRALFDKLLYAATVYVRGCPKAFPKGKDGRMARTKIIGLVFPFGERPGLFSCRFLLIFHNIIGKKSEKPLNFQVKGK